jgi:hypothetical protein
MIEAFRVYVHVSFLNAISSEFSTEKEYRSNSTVDSKVIDEKRPLRRLGDAHVQRAPKRGAVLLLNIRAAIKQERKCKSKRDQE